MVICPSSSSTFRDINVGILSFFARFSYRKHGKRSYVLWGIKVLLHCTHVPQCRHPATVTSVWNMDVSVLPHIGWYKLEKGEVAKEMVIVCCLGSSSEFVKDGGGSNDSFRWQRVTTRQCGNVQRLLSWVRRRHLSLLRWQEVSILEVALCMITGTKTCCN